MCPKFMKCVLKKAMLAQSQPLSMMFVDGKLPTAVHYVNYRISAIILMKL